MPKERKLLGPSPSAESRAPKFAFYKSAKCCNIKLIYRQSSVKKPTRKNTSSNNTLNIFTLFTTLPTSTLVNLEQKSLVHLEINWKLYFTSPFRLLFFSSWHHPHCMEIIVYKQRNPWRIEHCTYKFVSPRTERKIENKLISPRFKTRTFPLVRLDLDKVVLSFFLQFGTLDSALGPSAKLFWPMADFTNFQNGKNRASS